MKDPNSVTKWIREIGDGKHRRKLAAFSVAVIAVHYFIAWLTGLSSGIDITSVLSSGLALGVCCYFFFCATKVTSLTKEFAADLRESRSRVSSEGWGKLDLAARQQSELRILVVVKFQIVAFFLFYYAIRLTGMARMDATQLFPKAWSAFGDLLPRKHREQTYEPARHDLVRDLADFRRKYTGFFGRRWVFVLMLHHTAVCWIPTIYMLFPRGLRWVAVFLGVEDVIDKFAGK